VKALKSLTPRPGTKAAAKRARIEALRADGVRRGQLWREHHERLTASRVACESVVGYYDGQPVIAIDHEKWAVLLAQLPVVDYRKRV